MTNLTDSVWSKILPIALRFQYENSNISVECMSTLIKIGYGVRSQRTWATKCKDHKNFSFYVRINTKK
jgi:hypothetical protein